MRKLFVAVGLGVLFMGCAADNGWRVAYEQERANRQEQESRFRNFEAQQRQQLWNICRTAAHSFAMSPADFLQKRS